MAKVFRAARKNYRESQAALALRRMLDATHLPRVGQETRRNASLSWCLDAQTAADLIPAYGEMEGPRGMRGWFLSREEPAQRPQTNSKPIIVLKTNHNEGTRA